MVMGYGLLVIGYWLLKVRWLEGEEIVHREIPNGDYTDSEYFGEIEVHFQFPMEKEHKQIVDSQSDNRDQEEFSVFNGDVCVGALERPQPVPYIVVGGGKDETDGIGKVLVPAELLLAQPRGTEIDRHTRKADCAEFQELEYQRTINHGIGF